MADSADLAHLLRRTEFVAKPARLAELASMSIAQAVDDVLDIGRNGAPGLPAELTFHDEDNSWDQYVFAYHWWLDAMRTRARPVQEKMTLFWHGHFTSAWWDGVGRTDHMLRQNQLYRDFAVGNYITLAQRMALEPAMLLYLSNGLNVKGEPNQNFARELLELFLLGVGNYTEGDVDAAARAWTGHNYDWNAKQYVFRPTKHDTGNKTFFGTTKNWDGPDIINEVLRDNAGARLVAARFLARKLWEFFAHPGAPTDVVNALADVFLANGMEILPLLRALFNRPEFYSTTAKQGLVRTPTDWLVALSVHTGLAAAELGPTWNSERMGQSLFNPPNVSGWRPNAAWLNTSAVSGRAGLARHVTWKLRRNGGFDYLHSLSVTAAVDEVAAYFGLAPLSSASRDALVAAHTAERAATRWQNYWAPTNLLTMAMLTPEGHLA